MEEYKFTLKQINMMKHCIGFENSRVTGTKYRKMKAYRDYYQTDGNNALLDDLVQQGLMHKREISSKCIYYYMTIEGLKFLSDLTSIDISIMD